MESRSISQVTPDPVYRQQPPFPTQHINFIPTKIGKKAEFKVHLRNSFEYPIFLIAESNSVHFKTEPSRMRIQPGERVSFTVTFEPKKIGTWFGMITFSQLPDNTKRFFTVTGQGIK